MSAAGTATSAAVQGPSRRARSGGGRTAVPAERDRGSAPAAGQLDRRLQLVLPEAALQPPAVQEERRGPQHPAVQAAEGILPDTLGQRPVLEVPLVGDQVEAERPGVVPELVLREAVLVADEMLVHRPEPVLPPRRLG